MENKVIESLLTASVCVSLLFSFPSPWPLCLQLFPHQKAEINDHNIFYIPIKDGFKFLLSYSLLGINILLASHNILSCFLYTFSPTLKFQTGMYSMRKWSKAFWEPWQYRCAIPLLKSWPTVKSLGWMRFNLIGQQQMIHYSAASSS